MPTAMMLLTANLLAYEHSFGLSLGQTRFLRPSLQTNLVPTLRALKYHLVCVVHAS